MRKLILHNHQSPGDIIMLTAAVRDLHAHYPGRFLTDVRTPCPALWENNPHITPISSTDTEAKVIHCEYPLVHRSNQTPLHFIHGFARHLGEKLGLEIRPAKFHGDIWLSEAERSRPSQVAVATGSQRPYWIILAGGKNDFTIKWWETGRWQAVVDALAGQVLFIQAGEAGHHHPPLHGVIDMRGKTDARKFVLLMAHAQGVVCPVTYAMHLAAAVEVIGRKDGRRPCVVVAGGREPSHWEAYPGHQFIHTQGALPCCEQGGCWKSRVAALGDGDEKDNSLCSNVAGRLPRCMDMITPEEVVRRVRLYFDGGFARYFAQGTP
jgi:ADP-heptose:LPS heptosyltransferase